MTAASSSATKSDTPYAGIPWEIVENLIRLRLKPPSQWNVLLIILLAWCRYGRQQAWLSVSQLVDATNYSKRTVSAALQGLFGLGIIRRVGRCRKFTVDVQQLSKVAQKHSRGQQIRHAPPPVSDDLQSLIATASGNTSKANI